MELGNGHGGRDGIMAYVRASHPSNIRFLTNRFVADSSQMTLSMLIRGRFKATNSGVDSTR